MNSKLKNILIYITIPIVLCIGAFFIIKMTTPTSQTKYYEIVEMVRNNEISEYELNLYSGELKYVKRSDNKISLSKLSMIISAETKRLGLVIFCPPFWLSAPVPF